MEYYVQIFASAFDFIRENPAQVDVLQKEYVTFSENLLNYIGKKNVDSAEKMDTTSFFFSGVLDD